MWKELLKNEVWLPKWNTVTGKYNGTKVGFANVFGGPMTSSVVHQFGLAGTEMFIQTGYFGGLSHEVKYGDIFIVTDAVMQDGVSHWYLPNQDVVQANEELVRLAIDYCAKKGYSYSTGTVISTSAMLLETDEMVNGWADKGYLGVDMETATTLAIAKKFNKKAIGLLNLSDHIIKGDTLYSYTEERETLEMDTDDKIRDVALYLSTKVVE
ncbi:uridine phosphorylase [Aquibacillus koreensis]|uniref:Uridine phosphorylase n=1 Tax=Aquibacillus koreensis TaxID=279446 RepID=A0A9X3WNF0_9BACI|nr:uridine phosphorylase [Aquibacillus koreensis]MCT2536262.1 uridine phosphorylase [Aquibacillus koreensis]MDC3421386.1 uridine phosphorylase [Aquibacillus koreensis]